MWNYSSVSKFDSAASSGTAAGQAEASTATGGIELTRRQVRSQQTKLPIKILRGHPEIITALGALLLGGAFWLPRDVLTLLAILAVLALAWGWGELLHLPAPYRSAELIAFAGIAAVVLARIFADLAIVSEVAGIVVILAFVMEMTRFPREQLLDSVSGTVTGILIALSAGAWTVLGGQRVWHFMLIPAAITLLGASLGMALAFRFSPVVKAAFAMVFAVTSGIACGAGVVLLEIPQSSRVVLFYGGVIDPVWGATLAGGSLGLVVGALCGAMALMYRGRMLPRKAATAIALGIVPLLVTAIPVYALARLMGV